MFLLKVRTQSRVVYKFGNHVNNCFTRYLSSLPDGNKTVNSLPVEEIAKPNLESFNIPDLPNASELIEPLLQYNSLGEATFASLGLNSNWPTGWLQSLYETLHVTLHIPWWGVIFISAIAARSIMLPITVKTRKLSAVNSRVMPEITRIEKKISDSKLTNDYMTMIRYMKKSEEMKRSGEFKPFSIMFYSMLQFPIFITMMMALRQMATLPVTSLQTGGLFWFSDLTVADPYYILPVSTMFLVWLQIEVGAETGQSAIMLTPAKKWGIRLLPAVGMIITYSFPSALLLYWWSSSALSLVLAGAMRYPAVKKVLHIKDPTTETIPSGARSKLGIFDSYKQQMVEQRVYERAGRVLENDQREWTNAGSGAVPKTYKYDPTKVAQ